MIGVTKSIDMPGIGPLLDAGVVEFGENRWQHARDMLQAPRAGEAVWHFIGHLQTNKVKYIIPRFAWCHSIDSLELARGVSHYAEQCAVTMRCLIQVNVAGEETKSGVAPEFALPLLQSMRSLPNLEVRGFMTMAPRFESPETARPVFRALRNLLHDTQVRTGVAELCELSMGMSEDFLVAVEEGATMVRIGRRLMGNSGPVNETC